MTVNDLYYLYYSITCMTCITVLQYYIRKHVHVRVFWELLSIYYLSFSFGNDAIIFLDTTGSVSLGSGSNPWWEESLGNGKDEVKSDPVLRDLSLPVPLRFLLTTFFPLWRLDFAGMKPKLSSHSVAEKQDYI